MSLEVLALAFDVLFVAPVGLLSWHVVLVSFHVCGLVYTYLVLYIGVSEQESLAHWRGRDYVARDNRHSRGHGIRRNSRMDRPHPDVEEPQEVKPLLLDTETIQGQGLPSHLTFKGVDHEPR